MKTQGNTASLKITNPAAMASNGNVKVKSQANNSEEIKERTCTMYTHTRGHKKQILYDSRTVYLTRSLNKNM